ncbi:hypothetical protein BT96DRAFT_1008918 [Gymnopus androsaceus JB14]|uniref:Uncharacterized protein n=1 Tax=Gymnopus androsaceus JB14 TaxID=1447944 RepID=A0A6A4GDN8_9AGAR|nr:hypothetical protein BT96DRAFT_1008918 [Gymnopus androsaceus JB14]
MSTTIFAADPSITYSPQSAWSPNSDGTMTTNNAGAFAQLTFNGTFLEVFGTIPPTNSMIQHVQSLITLWIMQLPTGLASGSHSLVITAIATDNQADFVLATIVYDSNVFVRKFHSFTPPTRYLNLRRLPFPHHHKQPVSAVDTLRMLPRRKMSILARAQDSVSDYPPSPRPFLLGVPSETRANGGAVWSRESFVSLNLSPALNENSEPSGNSVVWGSIPHSVSTAPAVFGDRSNTSSLVNEKKDGSELVNSAPMPFNIALNRRSTVLTTGTKWTIQSGPPPSWTALSDAPPSYTTR